MEALTAAIRLNKDLHECRETRAVLQMQSGSVELAVMVGPVL